MHAILTDAFIITLATANTLNQDLGKVLGESADRAETLTAVGAALAVELSLAVDDRFGFVKAYARQAGLLAKACESWDHMENVPFYDLMRQSNLTLFKLIVAEATLRQLDLEALYRARLGVVETRSIFNRAFGTDIAKLR